MAKNLETEQKAPEAYKPEGEEKEVLEHLEKRVPILKDTKKNILDGFDFEAVMKEADAEYQPHSLRAGAAEKGGVMLVQDEIKGIRGSRIVNITGREGEEWRSDVSEPTLMVKIQTAISILVDQNPEAVFKALLDRYKPSTAVASAIYKRSWSIANSKEQLKTFIFNLAKYGWAPGRTYPRLVQRQKDVLEELDLDNPENNKYKTITVTEFDDVYREALDPYRTWIDDMADLYDPYSLDDWYFEKDFSKDRFEQEFGVYDNADKVKFTGKTQGETDEVEGNEETKHRDDVITLGFYESKNKDLYAIYAPNDGVVIYHSPLPNDEGKLSLWDALWNIRDPRTRYGIGLFEMMKNDKTLYDRLNNMDMDALVLSIYTMLFYSGSNQQTGDGDITISPGVMKQKLPGTEIDQIKIDYTGKGREGAQMVLERIDEITGITPTLQGQVEGKTLGEILHAKDAALKRLNIPLANIGAALEQDAYLTLSWANQLYTLPEVMEFVSKDELDDFETETGRSAERVALDDTGKITADFPRVLELNLDEDRDGALIESPESRFLTVGVDLPREQIRWKGRVTVIPQSIISPSQELDRQRKMELYNIVQPVVTAMSGALAQGQFELALDMARPVVQILEIQDEEPKDWLPTQIVELLANPEMALQLQQQAKVAAQAAEPLLVDPAAAEEPDAGPVTPTAPSEQAPELEGIAPKDEITSPVADTLSEIGKVR